MRTNYIKSFFSSLLLFLSTCVFAQDGSVDESFDIGNGFDGPIYALAVQADGKIIVGGNFSSYQGVQTNYLARLNPDGTLDETFNANGVGPQNTVTSLAIQEDGKIYVGGTFFTYNLIPKSRFVRLNSDGTIDYSYNFLGTGPDEEPLVMVLQPDGKLLIGGWFSRFNTVQCNALTRLNTDGSVDPDFYVNEYNSTPFSGAGNVTVIKLLEDGKILISGIVEYNGQRLTARSLTRLTAEGIIDTTFNTEFVTEGTIADVAVQDDGKIVIGGSFTEVNGTFKSGITRLTPNGFIDPSFKADFGTDGFVHSLDLQKDGKIILGGRFTNYDFNFSNTVARLMPDGQFDNTFDVGTGGNDFVKHTLIQPDGSILVAGDFSTFNGYSHNNFTRLLIDTTSKPMVCPVPTNLKANSVKASSALLTWDNSGANTYNVQYKKATESVWTSEVSATNSLAISGLNHTTLYEFKVQSVCSSAADTSAYSAVATFTTTDSTTSISEFAESQNLLVFPNPAKDDVQINLLDKYSGKVEIQLVAVTGKQVAKQALTATNGSILWTIPNTVIEGLHFMVLDYPNGKLYQKLFIKR